MPNDTPQQPATKQIRLIVINVDTGEVSFQGSVKIGEIMRSSQVLVDFASNIEISQSLASAPVAAGPGE